MWVTNYISASAGNRVEAYSIDLNSDRTAGPNHGKWETDKQFALRAPDGTTPVGIWSDGKGAVWITAPDSPKVESYNMLPFSAGSTTLSALAINDGTNNVKLRPTFDLTVVNYRTSVTDDVNRVTVSATPSASTATVAYLDANGEALEDADSNIAGFQVDVAVGTTLILIQVTAQDGAALIHSVGVERDSGLPGGWTPTDDLYDLDPVAVNYPRGIWSDGTTMWLTNTARTTVFAYTLATSARDNSKEFTLHTDNGTGWESGLMEQRYGLSTQLTIKSTPIHWPQAHAMQTRTSICLPPTIMPEASGPMGRQCGLPTRRQSNSSHTR